MNPAFVNKRAEIPVICLNPLTLNCRVTCKLGSPITTSLGIMTKRRGPGIVIPLTKGQGVLFRSLDGPLAEKDGKLPIAGFLLRIVAEVGRQVVGCTLRQVLVVVDVDVKDEVGIIREPTRPVLWVLETALEHNGDFRVDLGDVVEHGVDVFSHPRSAVV